MDSFLLAPAHAHFFPNPDGLSPGARLLAAGAPAQALEAVIATGWLDPDAAAQTDAQGIPALALWIEKTQTHFLRHAVDAPAGDWPVAPGQDWSAVVPPEMLHRSHSASEESRSQWVVGWCVANAPQGLGALRWTTPFTAEDPPAGAASILSWAAHLGWAAVCQQILRRSDAPAPGQLAQLRAVRPTRFPAAVSGQGLEMEVSSHGRRFLPLLHAALADQDLAVSRVLIEHGADPHQLDDQGVPAWYYAGTPDAFQMLVDHGLDPSRHNCCPISAPTWWARAKGSTEAASALVSCYGRWLDQGLGPAGKQALMPQLARSMETGSLSSFRGHLKAAGVSPHATWQAHSRTWTLATHALATVACSMGKAPPSATLAHGFTCGDLVGQEPVFAPVPNDVVAWWLNRQWADKRVGGVSASDFVQTVDTTAQWVQALAQWMEAPPAWFPRAATPAARASLARLAWQAQAQMPDGTDPAQARAVRNRVLDLVRAHGGLDTVREAATDSFSRSHDALAHGRLDEASRWARQGLCLWATLPPNGFSDGIDSSQARQALGKWLAGEKSDSYSLSFLRTCFLHLRHLQALVSQAPAQSFEDLPLPEDAFAGWATHPVMSLAWPTVSASLLHQNLPQQTPRPVPRSRM